MDQLMSSCEEDALDGVVFTASVDGQWPALVRLTGELDLAGGPILCSALAELDGDVALDCSRLDFIDAAGLRAILRGHEECGARGAKLVLLNPSPAVDRVVSFLELDTVLLVRRD
jgi:anti-anti-sigma factor